MNTSFFVLFDSNRSVFYQDSQIGVTTDVLLAERYNSYDEANNELKYFSLPIWSVKKVTITIE